MENKIELKKYLFRSLVISLVFICLFIALNFFIFQKYNSNSDQKIEQIVASLLEKYPLLDEIEIIEILNNKNVGNQDIFEKYGIDLSKDILIYENKQLFTLFIYSNLTLLFLLVVILILLFLRYDQKKAQDIYDITKLIAQINQKNYDLSLDSNTEDELSILKNEIYKTTIMLKEAAENSNLDKQNLKNSLEDISHQLKTPLTSILIMLDNLLDDLEMDQEIRHDFLKDIKREVLKINFFVSSILKLSKFDANTINFTKTKVRLKDIVEEAVKNVSLICELKNIEIKINDQDDIVIDCDQKWQVEALTNILKNCIEHSAKDKTIDISFSNNSIYSLLEIKDHGQGITKKDLPHIFERFYKGENSNSESVGIGLSLAKMIIEKDQGMISVESSLKGTIFRIKYFK